MIMHWKALLMSLGIAVVAVGLVHGLINLAFWWGQHCYHHPHLGKLTDVVVVLFAVVVVAVVAYKCLLMNGVVS